MSVIKIEKDIFVRDHYNVRRQVWLAGQEVKLSTYSAVLRDNVVVNPEDLPAVEVPEAQVLSINTTTMETKELPVEEVVEAPKPKAPRKKKK